MAFAAALAAAVETRKTRSAAMAFNPGGLESAATLGLHRPAATIDLGRLALVAAPVTAAFTGLGRGRCGDRERGNAGC
jgi:ABC-type arginine transport system permease subunit